MHYHVTARLKPGTAAALRSLLADGAIARQKPDGAEIVASMERAAVSTDGLVEWSEVCYCAPPLAHERATVYDRFFDDMTITPATGYGRHDGRPFLDWLDERASRSA
jgi:hypothetical protein